MISGRDFLCNGKKSEGGCIQGKWHHKEMNAILP